MKQIYERDLAPIITDITKEEFIQKVKGQHYFIDGIDALRLINFYVYEFGVISTYMETEMELCYMFQKICGQKTLKRDYYSKRVCNKCKISKSPLEYKDKVKHKTCAACLAVSTRKYRTGKI